MAQTQTLLLLLPLVASGQLASFEQLRRAWLGSESTQATIGAQSESREDRSLAGTYPFNLNNGQQAGGHHHSSAHQHSNQHTGFSLTADFAESSAPAFSLSAGFGSRSNPRGQYQIAGGPFRTAPVQAPAPSLTHSRASYQAPAAYETSVYETPAYETPAYQAPASSFQIPLHQESRQPVAAAYNPATTHIALAPSACPAVAGLPISQCAGQVNSCWAIGQADVDCPNHGLCCFNGCANVCAGAGPAPLPAPLPLPVPAPAPAPAPAVVVEARRPQPARRRKVAVKRLRPKNPFQGRQPLPSTTFRDVAASKERCIDKIETVEEIEYDEVEQCDHSYDKKCHTTYVTEYESQQEEECEDNFKKSCDITYSPSAQNVTVELCMRPLVKDCNLSGPEVCRTEYISECWTKNDPHLVEDDVPRCQTVQEEKCVEVTSGYTTEEDCKKWPREVCTISKETKRKFNPVTKCEKVPQTLCGPSGCGFVPGPEICHDEVKTIVTDIPQEVCDLQPQRSCEHVTKLVPKLSPVEECVDVPKEICTKAKVNPRTIQKPITKKWCYIPSEESGLA